MNKKYDFQIKYYEKLLKDTIAEYLKYLNDNKLPYNLDTFNKQIDKVIENIKKIIK